jgi:coniferyl-aldehyde dehydrogenase
MVPKGFEDEFVVHATMAIKTMFGALKDNPDYTSIINDRHFGRLRSWIEEARQKGAKVIELNPAAEDLSDPTLRRIAPTLILDATEEMTVLKEEIFGPILPVLTYDSIDDAIAYVRNHPHPLTLYYFGQDEAEERLVLDQTVSGGVTVNDCITHALAKSLPFGGIGHSGMGAYGGKAGFLTFSHARSIYRQGKSSEAELALPPPFTPAFQASLTEAINRGNFKE